MNTEIIGALLRKDLKLFFSNRFFALITVLALVFYVVIYFVMPAEVDSTLVIATYAPSLPEMMVGELAEEGIEMVPLSSAEAVRAAVLAGDYTTGVVLPETFTADLQAGQPTTAVLYFTAEFPPEFRAAYATLFQEIGYQLSGRGLNMNVTQEILGENRATNPIPYREKLLPLFAILVLMMETLGLANLIASEISSGTIRALLVSPMRMEGLFMAKGIFGVGLAFGQAALLMLVTGGLARQGGLILLALLLGAMLVTGVGFLIASVAKDMMSVMGWGILAMLLLMLPAFSFLLPGALSNWIEFIPSYHLVRPVYELANYHIGWADVAPNFGILASSAVGFMALGTIILRRRFTI